MDYATLKLMLSSSDSRNVSRALLYIRSREVKTQSGVQHLLDQQFLPLLISLLEKSNSRNIDISLSILANLLQSEVAQLQLRQCSGLRKLVSVVDNIQERNILSRGWRALANACQDKENQTELRRSYNVSSLLSRAVSSGDHDTDLMTVLVRSIRLCAPPDVLSQEPVIAETLLSLITDHGTDPGLMSVASKCVAKLSHSNTVFNCHSLLPAAESLVHLAKTSSKPDTAENCLGTLINLSQHDSFRPGLGAAGVVELLVLRCRTSVEQSRVSPSDVIRTLCLYCRESVNRVRMREGGGCAVLVSVLANTDQTDAEVRDTVLRSLLQFLYDNHSLNVLMSEGLVPCLINLLELFMEETNMVHTCGDIKNVDNTEDTEPEPEKQETENQEEEIKTDVQELNLSDDDDDEVTTDAKKTEEVAVALEDVTASSEKKKASSQIKSSAAQSKEEASSSSTPSAAAVAAPGKVEPVFRITSPSYQAVQYELEQFMQLRSSYDQHLGNISPHPSQFSPTSPSSPGHCSYSPEPGSPSSSLCQSPDRSPPLIQCSYSPASSPHSNIYSPLLYSPSYDSDFSPTTDPSYSPVENFSDEEEETTSDNSKKETCDKSATEAENEAKPSDNASDTPTRASDTKCDEPEPDPTVNLNPWTKRSVKIQRTTTYLGQQFILPSTSRERSPSSSEPGPSSKKPRLSSSSSYKYTSSLSPARKPISRQSSRSSLFSESDSAEDRVTWILQILSRLSQAERPHADLTSIKTIDTIITYLSSLPNSKISSSKASKFLTRLSTNLHCLFPFLLSRHVSRVLIRLEQWTEQSCDQCQFSHLRTLLTSVTQNMTLLAETGYGEGEICHRMVHPMIEKRDKQNIVISAALLVRQRKMLNNILIRHDTLDTLIDTLETVDDENLFSDCVYSISQLAAYLGVAVCCDHRTDPVSGCSQCRRHETGQDDDLTLVCDDGVEVECNRSVICQASHVFAAMLTGTFTEADQTRVPIPHTSSRALNCLIHFLYTCSPDTCPQYDDLPADTLLELVQLSDQYLLTDLNLSVCHTIIRHSASTQFLTPIYRSAVQSSYPVNCVGR